MVDAGFLKPGILTHQAIVELCLGPADGEKSKGDRGPIRPCRRQNIRTAGYDLRVGSEYYLSGAGSRQRDGRADTEKLTTKALAPGEGLCIEPNSIAVVSSLEQLHLGPDLVGRLTLKMDALLDGLIMASQSQIDAGYQGQIFALLYNLSDERRVLKSGSSFLRLELVRLPEASDEPYHGDYQDIPLRTALRRPLRSSLEDMRVKVDESSERIRDVHRGIRQTRVFAGLGAVLIGLLAIFMPSIWGINDDIDHLRAVTAKLQTQINAKDSEIRSLEDNVAAICAGLSQQPPDSNTSVRCPH